MSLSHKPISEMETMEYEERRGVGLWIITDFAGHFQSENMEEGEKHYRKKAGSEQMNATVVVIEGAEELGPKIRESLEHVGKQWSELGEQVDLERTAFVADGIMSSAVESKVQSSGETSTFDTLDGAVDWCQEVQ